MAEQGNSILNPSKFPIGRIRKVMKQDEDVKGQNIMQDALHMISIATELFLDSFTKAAYEYTRSENRKGVSYKDLAKAVRDHEVYEFLQDTIPTQIPYRKAVDRKKELDAL